MINQILELAHAPDFQKFTVVVSSGDRYQVPTRDHISIPPTENDEQPSYFIVFTAKSLRIVDVGNLAAIEVDRSAETV